MEEMVAYRSMVAAVIGTLLVPAARAQQPSTQLSSPSHHAAKAAPVAAAVLDSGVVSKGVYRNPGFGFTCKIPQGWVLRADEMNATNAPQASRTAARVLLAAFSRPPEAQGEDVNASILIAAESAASYPGLKEAAQYFGPLSEVAKAQGFEIIQEPYDFEIGAKILPRSDLQKDVGTRVMLQSTLTMLARGYAVSFTFIGGTEEEVEDLIADLSFTAPKPSAH